MNCRHSPIHPVSVPGSAAVHYTWFSPPLWFLWIHQDNMADRDTDQNTVSIYIWQAVTDLVGHSDLKYCAAAAVSDGVHFGRPASPHMLFTLSIMKSSDFTHLTVKKKKKKHPHRATKCEISEPLSSTWKHHCLKALTQHVVLSLNRSFVMTSHVEQVQRQNPGSD